MKQTLVEDAYTLSNESLREVLFRILFFLSCRGVATEEQVRILVELQYLEEPTLRVA